MGSERQVEDMAAYQKAYICPFRDGRPDLGKRFYVQFNPSELTIEEAIGVSDVEERDVAEEIQKLLSGSRVGVQSPLQSSSAQNRKHKLTLSATLFFNTLEKLDQDSYEDVRKYVGQLYPYTNKAAASMQDVEQMYFFWGSIAVAGILTRMSVHYTMFAPDGKPVRAQVEFAMTGDYVGDSSYAPITGAETGRAASFGKDGKNVITADGGSEWKGRYSGKGNPRLQAK